MANPTLPIVANSANTVIHGGATPPTAVDLGIINSVEGCVITDLKTAFPFTQDTYFDKYMQPLADVLHGFGFEITFNAEVHTRNTAASAGDAGYPTIKIGSLMTTAEAASMLVGGHDTRSWSGSGWLDGTQFIVKDGSGTFERQKLRKDSFTLQFRRYHIPA